jgi:hypothetical protein
VAETRADVSLSIDDVLRLSADALLILGTEAGTDARSGGRYEQSYLARFDELRQSGAAGPPPTARSASIENAAARSVDRFREAWEARDWERVAALHAPTCRRVDRRKMVRLELGRGAELETLRMPFEMRSSRFTSQLLATRGDRLALHWCRIEASGDGFDVGPSDVELLQVTEVDDHGDAVVLVAFDLDDVDAAYAELDRRHAGGEATAGARAPESVQRRESAPATKPGRNTSCALLDGRLIAKALGGRRVSPARLET